MGRKIIISLVVPLLFAISPARAQEVKTDIQENAIQEPRTSVQKEKPKRNPIIDTFTRIDPGEEGIDALVVFGHPLYFAYKGIADDAMKRYDMEKFHVFLITINSQKKVDLSGFKVEASTFIRTTEGLEYPAVPQWIPLSETPSKRSGIIRFFQIDAQKNKVLKDDAKSFEIVIKGLGGVPERTFHWPYPINF